MSLSVSNGVWDLTWEGKQRMDKGCARSPDAPWLSAVFSALLWESITSFLLAGSHSDNFPRKWVNSQWGSMMEQIRVWDYACVKYKNNSFPFQAFPSIPITHRSQSRPRGHSWHLSVQGSEPCIYSSQTYWEPIMDQTWPIAIPY